MRSSARWTTRPGEKVAHPICAARGATDGLMAEAVEDCVRADLDLERHPGASWTPLKKGSP
jgi:hypothetical protein